MTSPSWQEDNSENLSLIQGNAAELTMELGAAAADRILPTRETLCYWHARLYAGCDVPVAGYLGHFRGDLTVKELLEYISTNMPSGSRGSLPANTVADIAAYVLKFNQFPAGSEALSADSPKAAGKIEAEKSK